MTDEQRPASAGSGEVCLPPALRKRRFNPVEAPSYLLAAHGVKVAKATLDKLRSVGGGPEFHKFNHAVLYDRAALDAWAAEKLGQPRRSTSEVQ